jgi:hypothetical protein
VRSTFQEVGASFLRCALRLRRLPGRAQRHLRRLPQHRPRRLAATSEHGMHADSVAPETGEAH